jgi:hypothetical protein
MSDRWFMLWLLVWALITNIDFAFEFGKDKPASIVVQSREPSKESTEVKKEEPSVGDTPKPSW